ncbi:unnamed protein product [Pleuronectes platessa]|uniref:Uncharacterized protein n=1 Tax=Pleuronectes platessa TaxID=8262 RepID=A0A9N7VFN3_PLEPL|nr:unnamed protein product [Pleuronectes platessa]
MPSSPAAITVHGQQPSRHDPPCQTRRHSSPQSPSTAAHQDPSEATTAVLVTARAQCQRDTGSTTSTRSAHMTQNPPHWIHHHDPGARSQTAIHGCGHRGPGSAGDQAKGFRGRGIGWRRGRRSWKEKLRVSCVIK